MQGLYRITVTANTENNFASIVEITVGSKKSPNPSPPPQVLISVSLTFPYLMLNPVEVNQETLHQVQLITIPLVDGQIKGLVHGYKLTSEV